MEKKGGFFFISLKTQISKYNQILLASIFLSCFFLQLER